MQEYSKTTGLENPINPTHDFNQYKVFFDYTYIDFAEALADIANLNVILVLHGLGERGTNIDLLNNIEFPRKLDNAGVSRTGDMYVCPQIQTGEWDDDVPANMALRTQIDLLNSTFAGAIDYDLTGTSLGGFGCYSMMKLYPSFFRTCGVLCGNDHQLASPIAYNERTQVRHWHGTNDTTVSYASGVASIQQLVDDGYVQEATFVPLVGLAHSIWKRVYDDDELYWDWYDVARLVDSGSPNQPPVVDCGADQSITLPTNSIDLTAVASDPNGAISSYQWTKESGGVCTLTNDTTPNLSVTNMIEDVYVFRCLVTGDAGLTAFDDVQVTVSAITPNEPPTVDCGRDQEVRLPTDSIDLTAAASDTDGTIASYQWTKESGPACTLTNTTISVLSVTNMIEGVYLFGCLVTDNEGLTAYDEVQISVIAYVALGKPNTYNAEELALWQDWAENGKTLPANLVDGDYANVLSRADEAVGGLQPDELRTNLLSESPGANVDLFYSNCAAFVYLITEDLTYGNHAKTFLLAQIREPISEWSQYMPANNEPRDVDVDVLFSAPWYCRLYYMYDYVYDLLSASEIAELENWFYNWARFYADILDDMIDNYLPSRLIRYYGDRTGWAASGEDSNPVVYTHEEPEGTLKNKVVQFTQLYTNAHMMVNHASGLWAAHSGDESLTLYARIWFEECLKFATFPDGTDSEYRRNGNYGNQGSGANLYSQIGLDMLVILADAFWRKGDSSWYEFATKDGLNGTEVGGDNGVGKGWKSIRNRIEAVIENYTQEVIRYDDGEEWNITNKLVTNPTATSTYFNVPEAIISLADRFYEETRLEQTYLNTIAGSVPYASGMSQPNYSGVCKWGGILGTLTGNIPFMIYGTRDVQNRFVPIAVKGTINNNI